MSRVAIPEAVQNGILLRSRRRCCLCFWLDGVDEVVKGQLAHLDHDHENSVEDNLAFMCLEHHDAYDGKTSVSKGFREGEVRRWRDELYREMEYRFRTIRTKRLFLTVRNLVFVGTTGAFKCKFRLTNMGDIEIRRIAISIRLPEKVAAEPPKHPQSGRFGVLPDLFGMKEACGDFFEPNGRIGLIEPLHPAAPVLLTGHWVEFDGLSLNLSSYPLGSELELDYRIDAEEMSPFTGQLRLAIDTASGWIGEGMLSGNKIENLPETPAGRAIRTILQTNPGGFKLGD